MQCYSRARSRANAYKKEKSPCFQSINSLHAGGELALNDFRSGIFW